MEKFISGSVVEEDPTNEHFRTFHMRHKLIKGGKWFSSEFATMGILSSNNFLPSTKPVFDSLVDIDGVKNVTIKAYEIGIFKAEAFSWDELYPKIKLAMARYLPATYN